MTQGCAQDPGQCWGQDYPDRMTANSSAGPQGRRGVCVSSSHGEATGCGWPSQAELLALPLLAMWPWRTYLAALCLNFLLCKMGTTY